MISDDDITNEIAALKAAFSYRSFSLDMDFLLDDLDRAVFSDEHLAGRSIYAFAEPFLIDCYYEKGALEPLFKMYSGHAYRVASWYERLLEALVGAKRFDLIEQMWRSVIQVTRAEYFYQRPGLQYGDHERVEKYRNYVLDAYDQAVQWLNKIDKPEQAKRLLTEKEAFENDAIEPLDPPSDLRKVDEAVFWDLISQSKRDGSTPMLQVASLGELVRAFKATEIKRFTSLYAKAMKRLYHWNVWALAYAACGGCSDSAFEEFRTWLILIGDQELIDLAINKPEEASQFVPYDPALPNGSLSAMLGEAYFLRKGDALPLPSLDLDRPKGKEWAESEFETRFSKLSKRYSAP